MEGKCLVNDKVYKCINSNISKKGLLCFYEKLEIVTYQNQKELLKKRSEFLCKCHQDNKFLLRNNTGNDFRKLAILSSRKKSNCLRFNTLLYVCKNKNKILLPDDRKNVNLRVAIN